MPWISFCQRITGFQQAVQDHGQFIRSLVRNGGHPPVVNDLLAVEYPEHRIGVLDVNGQQCDRGNPFP